MQIFAREGTMRSHSRLGAGELLAGSAVRCFGASASDKGRDRERGATRGREGGSIISFLSVS